MRLSVKSCCALVLAGLVVSGVVSGEAPGLLKEGKAYAGPPTTAAQAPSRPVVIIDEPSLGRYLESVGYTRGKDLFEVHLGELYDLESGAMQVSLAVREALSGSGSRDKGEGERLQCDIVAAGLPGMVARYALEKGYLSDLHVVNLVMAATPNRGTFLAGIVKSALEIVRQESILERETRAERFLPSLRDIFGGEDDVPVSLKDISKAKSLKLPEWEEEASWIATRSTALWEPLYAEYVKNRFFALPYVPTESPKETFAGWVRRTLPDVWKRLIVDAQWPASQGQPLSLPYYECLAMEVAKNQYVMRTASKGGVVSSLLKDPVIPKDWKEAAFHYGTKLLLHFAQKALITVKAELQEFIAREAVKFTGLGSGPESPFIPGLIKEDILINLGTSSSRRFERIPANLTLAELNRLSQSSANRRDTRYVSIVSRLMNPLGLIWPELGPNDSLLEVDCGVPPTGTRDLIVVLNGVLRLPGKHVLDDKRAQEYVAQVLMEDLRGSQGAQGSQGQPSLSAVDASSWRPVWCPVQGVPKVSLGITELPSGWQCQVWEECGGDSVTGEGEEEIGGAVTGKRKQGVMWGFDQGGTKLLHLTPGTVRLGFRLVRSGPLNPVVGNTVASAFAQEILVRVFVAPSGEGRPEAGETPALPGPADPIGPGGSAGTEEPVGAEEPAGVEEPVESEEPASSDETVFSGPDNPQGSPKPEGPDDWPHQEEPTVPPPPEEALPEWEEDTELPEDLPTIRVVYRSKHTTLKKPKETVHDHWVLDYGDGSLETVQGQVSLAVDHTFESPGDYSVTAESYTSQGELLYRKTWQVRVVLSDETHRFTCQSIAPVSVDVVLKGPKKWVTGKVAVFSVGAIIDLPSNAELVSVKYDPGETFGVIWERAGDFVVGAAVSIIVKYSLEDAYIEVENVFLKEVPVTVLTTGVTG